MSPFNADVQIPPGNVDQFKAFLSRPRRFKNLVFSSASRYREEGSQGVTIPPSEKGSQGGTTTTYRMLGGNIVLRPDGSAGTHSPYLWRTHYWHAAVDGDNFFMRGIDAPENWVTKRPRVFGYVPPFVGRYGGRCFYVQDGMVVADVDPALAGVQGPPPGANPARRALPMLTRLDCVMNLGLWDVFLNSFSWIPPSPGGGATSAVEFTAERGRHTLINEIYASHQAHGETSRSPEVRVVYFKQPIRGRIEIVEGRVSVMKLESPPLSVRYEYSEANPLPLGLPNKFSLHNRDESGGSMEIFVMEESAEAIPEAHFLPEHYLGPGHYRASFVGTGITVADPTEAAEYWPAYIAWEKSRPKG